MAIELLHLFFRTYSSNGGSESKWKLTTDLRLSITSLKNSIYIFLIPLLIVVLYPLRSVSNKAVIVAAKPILAKDYFVVREFGIALVYLQTTLLKRRLQVWV